MTSPKIVRERQEESARNILQHRLLSSAYSLIQQNYQSLQHTVKELAAEDGFSSIKSVKVVSQKESAETLHVYAPPDLSDETTLESLKSKLIGDREESKKSSEKFLSAVAIMESGPLKPERAIELSGAEMAWIFSPENSTVNIVAKGKTGDPSLDSMVSGAGTRIMDNFPHPYISNLDPLIKFSFISLNYARTGKSSLSTVLYESSSEAYAYSVGQERDRIRSDFSELLADMDKAGLITARGNETYFPKNGAKFERAFIRKYWDYVEKIGKRTLFDFESPF